MEYFYFVEKQSKENFVEKIRRLVDSGIVKTCDELDLYDHEMLPMKVQCFCICPLCECLHPCQ